MAEQKTNRQVEAQENSRPKGSTEGRKDNNGSQNTGGRTDQKGETKEKGKKDVKVVRVIKRWHCKLYTCNAGRLSNKMAILAHDAQKLKLGVIHISEAGVGPAAPMGLSGYTVIKLERSGPNRGSLMYIRNDIYPRCLRIFDPKREEEETCAEIMHIQLDTDTKDPRKCKKIVFYGSKSIQVATYIKTKTHLWMTLCDGREHQ